MGYGFTHEDPGWTQNLCGIVFIMTAKAEGVADKGTKKCPFDCFVFWHVVHAFHPMIAVFNHNTGWVVSAGV